MFRVIKRNQEVVDDIKNNEELSPREKVEAYYSDVNANIERSRIDHFYGQLRGIENTLDMLGITVKGINDKEDDSYDEQ